MKKLIHLATLSTALLTCHLVAAQTAAQSPAVAPGTRPAGATGICKDGTYSTEAAKSGACRGHHGVQEWYTVAAATPATPAAQVPAPATTPVTPSPTTQVRTQSAAAAQSAGQSDTPPATQSITPPTAPATTPSATASTKTPVKKGPRAKLANTPEAPGGGPGLVWVNTSSNVYHCPGTDYYGKTKKGSYMPEADARAKGVRANGGKACPKS
ncbi:DUF3761 domain-containing protein [Granulicella arctica]|uniref:DUF3761 domain-containing protein n=1 Tax=Granulicella arctica TaxID=940613 RepID=UPI0021E0F756|nr:DUF3761 domain-containing protein [Granulicella arctica]